MMLEVNWRVHICFRGAGQCAFGVDGRRVLYVRGVYLPLSIAGQGFPACFSCGACRSKIHGSLAAAPGSPGVANLTACGYECHLDCSATTCCRDSRLRIYSPDATLTLLVLGLLYFICQILLTNGIKNTSANFCTAMQPSIPVFGAVFAIFMRVEKLNWPRVDGQAKVGGILLCCLGAIVMAVWEGPRLFGGSGSSKNLLGSEFTPSWSLGVVCILLYCIGTSLNGCFIASLLSKYPRAPTTITAYTVAIGAALLGVAGSLHGSKAWKVSSTWSLLAAGYNGLAGSAIASVLIAWSIGQVGPILATCYMPVQPVTSLVVSSIFLGASVYLGSVLGAVLVIAGLLLISWSRAESLKHELEEPLL